MQRLTRNCKMDSLLINIIAHMYIYYISFIRRKLFSLCMCAQVIVDILDGINIADGMLSSNYKINILIIFNNLNSIH